MILGKPINTVKYIQDQRMDISEMRYQMREEIDNFDIDNNDMKIPIWDMASRLPLINRRTLSTPKTYYGTRKLNQR